MPMRLELLQHPAPSLGFQGIRPECGAGVNQACQPAWLIAVKRLAQALCCWINHVGRPFQAAAKTKKPVAVRAITGPDGILK